MQKDISMYKKFGSFNENVKQINEGGNLTIDTVDGSRLEAQKIDMSKSTRKEFRKKSLDLFKTINFLYKKEYGEKLWVNEKKLDSGELFNGSTSFIFSDAYSDEEIMKYKTKSGDIDVIIPKEKALNLWHLLKKWEDKEISPGITYKGNNRTNKQKLGNQINAIFVAHFSNGYKVPMQVDFEMLNVAVDGTPDVFARFSHSSTFEDMKAGQKGVAHKYLMIAIAGGLSFRDDIYVVTEGSTEDNYKIRKSKGVEYTALTNMKFSVDHGLRSAFTKMDWQIDGKDVFKELPSKGASYEQNLETIFELFFKSEPTKTDMKKMWSMVGLLDLMKKYSPKKDIKITYDRMLARTLKPGAQPLERGNPDLDYQIKSSMLDLMKKEFPYLKDYKVLVEPYYKNYK